MDTIFILLALFLLISGAWQLTLMLTVAAGYVLKFVTKIGSICPHCRQRAVRCVLGVNDDSGAFLCAAEWSGNVIS